MRAFLAALLTSMVALAPGFAFHDAGAGLELDRRRMLNAAEHAEWKGVGRVNVATDHALSMCTGTLIAPDEVLTAAHCVINRFTGRPHRLGNIYFVAGWRMGQKVAARGVAALAIHPDYRFSDAPGPSEIAADLALLRLDAPIPPTEVPPFAVAPLPAGAPLVLISYRQDRPHALTRQEGCEVLKPAGGPLRSLGRLLLHAATGIERDGEPLPPNVVALGCDVTFGASGSPLFARIEGAPRVVAVMSAIRVGGRRPVAYAVLAAPAIERLRALLP